MLIVSQDREFIVNLDVVESISCREISIRAFMINDEEGTYYKLGTYKSKESAKCKLEQLWSAYTNGDKVFIMPEK